MRLTANKTTQTQFYHMCGQEHDEEKVFACKYCGEEGSIWNLFNPIIEGINIHEECIPKAIEEGRIDILGSLLGIEE